MRFCELTEEEFRDFSFNHELRNFLQSPEMARAKILDGCNCYYVGVKKSDAVVCATLLIGYSGKYFKTFTSPRGYLIDYNDECLLSFFTKEIKKYLKKKGAVYLNIEPNVLYKERDINGELVNNGFDNSKVYKDLLKLGYKHNGFYLEMDMSKQCRWEFILNLKDKTKDELFNNFKANARNIIRRNQKYGIAIRELEYNELDKFYEVVESSGSRKNFHSRSVSYYQKMYDIFHDKGEVKYLVTELNIKNYLEYLHDELEKLEKKLNRISNDIKRNENVYREISEQIDMIKKRETEAQIWSKQYGAKPITSCAMFILYGTEIVYLFSGSRSEFINMKSQFSLQWYIIQYGVDNGYEVYNFGGITGDLRPSHSQYGVYEFKKNFHGNVIEYIGDFDLIISPFKYYLKNIINKLRR